MTYLFPRFKALLKLGFNYSRGCNTLSERFGQSLIRDYNDIQAAGGVEPMHKDRPSCCRVVKGWLMNQNDDGG